jgi:alpha-glucosidase (family GH31 glycosyl hydrolase)
MKYQLITFIITFISLVFTFSGNINLLGNNDLYEYSRFNFNQSVNYSTNTHIDDELSDTTIAKNYIHPPTQNLDSNIILPPAWAFGVLYGGYTNQVETIERVKAIINHNYPIDAYWIDSWFWSFDEKGRGPKKYIDFVADTITFPNRQVMWSYLESNNIKGGFWIWDCIMQTGNEEAFEDFNSKEFFRNIYIEKGSWHNYNTTTAMHELGKEIKGTPCGNINFEDQNTVDYFKGKVKHFFDEGADFIKLDRTSAIPVCKTMFEITQEFGKETKGRGFILSHTGGMETDEYKKYPAKWTDDTRSDWTVEKPTKEFNSWVPEVAFKENIAMFTDTNKVSNTIPFLTNDLGGFDIGIDRNIDEELYIRWLQFSMLTPIVEVFSQPENPTSNLAYLYSERADTLFKFYSHLRMMLFPYIYSYAHNVRLTGQQILRSIPGSLYEYMFGNELLIAPVYTQGATSRELYLPVGNWIDYWTEKVYAGEKNYILDAPIENIPIFVRSGSIIPMRNYSQSIEKGTNDSLIIHIYPGNDCDFSLNEDDGKSNDYLKGIYAQTNFKLIEKKLKCQFIISPTLGNYKNMNQNRNWRICFHTTRKIKSVLLNGKELQFENFENDFWTSWFRSDKYKQNRIEFFYE